jgi:hypothetical protein
MTYVPATSEPITSAPVTERLPAYGEVAEIATMLDFNRNGLCQ